MGNPTQISGLQPRDVLYLLYQGNRLRLKAARCPAAGELLLAELKPKGRGYVAGPFAVGTEKDLREWRHYGRIDDEGRFVSTRTPERERPQAEQLALALG